MARHLLTSVAFAISCLSTSHLGCLSARVNSLGLKASTESMGSLALTDKIDDLADEIYSKRHDRSLLSLNARIKSFLGGASAIFWFQGRQFSLGEVRDAMQIVNERLQGKQLALEGKLTSDESVMVQENARDAAVELLVNSPNEMMIANMFVEKGVLGSRTLKLAGAEWLKDQLRSVVNEAKTRMQAKYRSDDDYKKLVDLAKKLYPNYATMSMKYDIVFARREVFNVAEDSNRPYTKKEWEQVKALMDTNVFNLIDTN